MLRSQGQQCGANGEPARKTENAWSQYRELGFRMLLPIAPESQLFQS
ncbi:hypothetical protein HDF16_006289 [Granulicella aggregans]|uniref:Uncharacterized protein n=1 Tax=Granulicella aggregans TaxID=474949 RepID=A0A7W7ZKJ9_9BACT|nr:hypothetical protein [Granulicella aggregans]